MSDRAVPGVVGLCADDYGLDAAINAGIVALASQGRLSALSCITTGPDWPQDAKRLEALDGRVEVGLHLNLTEGEPLAPSLRRRWPRFPALGRLLLAAATRQLPTAALGDEWRAQWDRFAEATGRAPDFVDGHQHVHHLNGVREHVLEAARSAAGALAVRNTGSPRGPGSAVKRRVIRMSGGVALQAALRHDGLPHNALLLGVYGFHAIDYRVLMRQWLAAAREGGALIFCHPAAEGARDAIAAARRREAAYLSSGAFTEDLAAASLTLGRAWVRSSSDG